MGSAPAKPLAAAAFSADAGAPMLAGDTGYTEIVKKLLAANASVDQADNDGDTPMAVACENGHLGCVQLLSSYGASRTLTPTLAPNDTAEHLATHRGHHDVAAWLVTSRHWSLLHHLESVSYTHLTLPTKA